MVTIILNMQGHVYIHHHACKCDRKYVTGHTFALSCQTLLLSLQTVFATFLIDRGLPPPNSRAALDRSSVSRYRTARKGKERPHC